MPRTLRYKIDLMAVFNVLLTVGRQVYCVLLGAAWYAVVPLVLLVRQVSIIRHNHAHPGDFSLALRLSHHGAKYRHRYDMAVEDLTLPFRFLGYNQGYHLEHHLKPTLHWSPLSGFHESIWAESRPRTYATRPRVSEAARPTASASRSKGLVRLKNPTSG